MIQFLGDEQYAKEFLERVNKHIDDHGFVIFATELKETGELICFVGLAICSATIRIAGALPHQKSNYYIVVASH